MASRSRPERRSESSGDSLEAVKPLIVLVLFGTILYGAYSVVQKGPAPEATQANAPEAPPFVPPAVELATPATPQPPVAAVPPADASAPATAGPPAPPPAAEPAPVPAASPVAAPTPPAIVAVPAPAGPSPAPLDPAAATPAPPPAAVASPPTPTDPAAAAPAGPTYLDAQSAPPPAQEDVTVPGGPGSDRPERLATLASAGAAAASLPPEMPQPTALPSSAAFATAWDDAHGKLAAGRYAEALTALSVWHDDPSLSLEESHRLEDLLSQLAGTVIYSQDDLLQPPHVVAPNETLPAIAATLGVSWRLLAKINGVEDPLRLVPGEHLKVVRGPFDAVLSVSRRRLSLQLRGAYAGSFPVVVGREFLSRVGSSLPVGEVRPAGPAGPAAILLGGNLALEGTDDPAAVADAASPTRLIVSTRDLAELVDILGPGSSVLVRQ